MSTGAQLNKEFDYFEYYTQAAKFSVVPANALQKKGALIPWKQFQQRKPTTTEIEDWNREFPEADLAIVTGRISNIIVLDIDPRHDGDETIKDFDTPETVTVETGGGGLHYYFKYPELDGFNRIKNFTGDDVDLPGVDLRADGGMVFAPPSCHPSGNLYKFERGKHPGEIEIAESPGWLVDVIRDNQKRTKVKLSKVTSENLWSGVSEGSRNNSCSTLAGKLLNSDVPYDVALKLLLRWNQKNNPPLEDKEVEKVVKSIYRLYEKEDMERVQPTQIAKMLMKKLKSEDELWIYIPEAENYYVYEYSRGYFETRNEEYLKENIRKLLIELNPDWERSSNISEVLKAYNHQVQNIKAAKKLTNVEKNLEFINVTNGMLNWKTCQLEDHNPKYFSLYQLPVEYDPQATCDLWKKTLDEWLPDKDTRNFLQEFVGYCLIPDTSMDKAVFLLGAGANGKTTFLDVLRKMFGHSNMTSIPLHRLGSRFETSSLHHSLVNACDDIDPVYLRKTGTIKSIVSGGMVRGEEKFKSSFEFFPVTRLIFAANEMPAVKDTSYGWHRRFEIVKFDQKFSPNSEKWNPHLKTELMHELPGIFNWALEGLKRLKEQGEFTNSDSIQRANSEYQQINDSVVAFVADRVKRRKDEPEFVYPKKIVFEKYKEYCKMNNLKAVSRKKMSRRMAGSEINLKTGRRRRHRYNLEKEKADEILPSFEPSIEKVRYQEEAFKNKKSVTCFVGIEIADYN